MKKSKKIMLGLLAWLGISSLIAVSCGLIFNNANVSTQATSSNASSATSISQNANNTLTSQTNNASASTSSINNPVGASLPVPTVAPNSNAPTTVNSASTNPNQNQSIFSNISNSNKLPYNTTDTSTLVSTNNTFTYKCANGNVLLFSINNNNVNTVTLLGFAQKVSNDLIIPNVIITNETFYAVTAIAAGAFYGQNLTSVTFNSDLQTIGALAFANNSLSSLTLPNNLQSIGNEAFISNQFPHAYAVYMPNNTSWSKNWLTCPFGNKNNLSKLVNGIQFVIQSSAVYEFQPDQNAWVIVSYNITNDPTSNSQWTTSTGSWGRDNASDVAQQTPDMDYAKNINVNLSTSFNGNLSDFCLYTQNESEEIGWVFYFDPTNHTFNVFTGNNYLFGNGVSTTLDISLYDPYSGKYIFDWQLNASDQSVPQTSFPYQIGDIFSYQVNNTQSDAWAYIASNFNSSLLSNYSLLNITLNRYIDLYDAWTEVHGLQSNFVIKPTGIYPTSSTTNLSNVSYNPTTGLLNLVGTSLPNMQYGVYYGGSKVGTFNSDNNGNINASLKIQENLTATDNITISALSATNNNTNVVYPAPYTTHLQGFNPKESFLQLQLDGISTQMMFDGFTNHVQVVSINTTWPAYATNDGYYSTDSLASSATFDSSGSLTITIKNQTGTIIWNKPFNYTNGEDVSQLYAYLNSLPYENGYTYTFLGDDYSFSNIFNNGQVVPYGSSKINGVNQSSFIVNNTGITCTTNQSIHNGYLGAVNEYNFYGANSSLWKATYGWLACSYGDMFTTDLFSENWYNPNQYMVEVAKQIAATYPNPVNEVMAIFNWTYNNITYGTTWAYYQTVRGYFEHLEGVCANISDVFGALLKIDGFVSRQVYGSVDSINVNQVENNMVSDLDHEWTQVWMPSLQEWITLDPTWNWALPFGDVESQFNVERSDMAVEVVEWPEVGTGQYYDNYGTLTYHNYEYDNYFSYFKGCEYQALLNLGRDFDILPGMYQNIYRYSYAADLADIINWAASPANSMKNNNYVLNSMNTQ